MVTKREAPYICRSTGSRGNSQIGRCEVDVVDIAQARRKNTQVAREFLLAKMWLALRWDRGIDTSVDKDPKVSVKITTAEKPTILVLTIAHSTFWD